MRNNSGFSSLSGLLSILGLLTVITGLVFMVVLKDIKLAAWGTLAIGALLLGTAFAIDFRKVSTAIRGRKAKFSTGTTVMASIFIGIVLLVNAISIGTYQRFDSTGLSSFTLTSQTKESLTNLEMPVTVIGFFVPGDPYEMGIDISVYAESILAEYQKHTTKLTIKRIDPDEHPEMARQYNVRQYESVVFETELGRRLVSPSDIVEQAEFSFTSAILEVTGTVQKKLYFLTGHGEAELNGAYSTAKQGLLDNLYNVGSLDLLLSRGIPEDTAAIIIAGPTKSPSANEVKLLSDYLKNGGWMMLMLDPSSPPEFRQLLAEWKINMKDGIIIDPSSYVSPNKEAIMIERTRNVFGFSTTYLPGASAIVPDEDDTDKLEHTPLAWTSTNSWIERDFISGEEPKYNEGSDEKGAFATAVLTITATPEEGEDTTEFFDTRIIAIGDSDFASNQHFLNGDNGNFFLNSVNILTAGKELITVERKVLPFRRMVIGPEAYTFIQISSIALLPVLVIIAGAVIWWRRR